MKFIEKINYRLISIHLLATIFLLLGAKRFFLLYDLDFIQSYYSFGTTDFLNHLNDTTGGSLSERMTHFLFVRFFSILITLTIAFIISLIISLRARIFWLNSFIVLILAFLINRFGLLDFEFVKIISNAIGNIFISHGLKYVIIINGGVLTIIGIIIYFNKWTKTLISRQNE